MLRNLENRDIEGMLEWMHDEKVNEFFQHDFKSMKREDVALFIQNSQDKFNKHFAIAGKRDEYLGTISLKNIDYNNKNAEYAISIRKIARGTNVAQIATKQLLEKAFGELDLLKVYLNVLSTNTRAIRFYEKMNFEYEGTFKEHVKIKDKFYDLLWYGMRKSIYLQSMTMQ